MVISLQTAEELALATRLRRLSDRLFQNVDEAYQAHGHDCEGRWFGVLFLLSRNERMGITELADEIGQTHSAISQLSKKLAAEGLVTSVVDPGDSRRRLLELSSEGRAYVGRLQPMWRSVTAAITRILQDANASGLLGLIAGVEEQLDQTPLRSEILVHLKRERRDDLRIVDLSGAEGPASGSPEGDRLRAAFKELNVAWLQEYFYVEEHDDRVLSDPDTHILEPGGRVFLALLGDVVVGAGALIRHDEEFELTKMAVNKDAQGLGIGEQLVRHAIALYGATDATGLFLESSFRLKPALKLYEKTGFVRMPHLRPGSKYTRAEVYMRFRE